MDVTPFGDINEWSGKRRPPMPTRLCVCPMRLHTPNLTLTRAHGHSRGHLLICARFLGDPRMYLGLP